MPVIRTVLGDISVADLGRTDYHEHLFQVSPLLPGDELTEQQLADRFSSDIESGIHGCDSRVRGEIADTPEGRPVRAGMLKAGIGYWSISTLIDCLVRTAELGAADRLLLGGDVAQRTRYVGYGGMPGLAYLGERVLPRLDRHASELAATVLVDNPARLLADCTIESEGGIESRARSEHVDT